jgi:hypothetical protein
VQILYNLVWINQSVKYDKIILNFIGVWTPMNKRTEFKGLVQFLEKKKNKTKLHSDGKNIKTMKNNVSIKNN